MNDIERVELNELCSALMDGTLTETQRARMEEMLLASQEARRFYVRTMALSASLIGYAAEMQTPEPLNIIRPPQWRRWISPLAAAAVILLGVWIGRSLIGGKSGDAAADGDEMVAHISGGQDCQWAAATPGDELAPGQRLELKSGFAEITFDSGAQLVLEGPATLDVRSAWEAELQRGTVKANVPQEAIGFTLTNATVQVVDLGTEFSMTAGDDGAAEVFVLKGAVEVQPRNTAHSQKSVLREKQSRRFAKNGGSEVRDSDAKFQRLARKVAMVRRARPMAYARWHFDEGDGDLAASETNGFSAGALRVEGSSQHWSEGRWGKALAFDGSTTAKLDAALPRGARTVAFWTRLSETAPSNDGALAGVSMGKGTFFEFLTNTRPGQGTPGALRLQSGNGWFIGSTPLRDGRWHHIAAVFGANPKNATKPGLALYVDGRLETPSGRHALRRSDENAGALWLGGAAGSSERFQGLLDELLVADRQLSPQEIRHLMRTNQLLSPETVAAN